MSVNGIATFEANLRKVMASDAFKKGNDADRLKIGEALLRSEYGAHPFKATKPLPPKEVKA